MVWVDSGNAQFAHWVGRGGSGFDEFVPLPPALKRERKRGSRMCFCKEPGVAGALSHVTALCE